MELMTSNEFGSASKSCKSTACVRSVRPRSSSESLRLLHPDFALVDGQHIEPARC